MSKRKKAILLIIILVLLLTVFIGYLTFCKYISTVQGGGKAEIAKWIFTSGFEEQITNLSLKNTASKETLVNGKIAPGTNGKFNVLIDATGSEVGVEYSGYVDKEENKPQNIIFKISGNEKEYYSLQDLFSNEIKGVIYVNSENKQINIPIEWNWPYESGETDSDIKDTSDGINAKTYSFSVNIIGKQIS